MSSVVWWPVLCIGCTSVLGIDGTYELGVDAAGGGGKSRGSGGRRERPDAAAESGGTTSSSGGQGGSGGEIAASAGGAAGGNACGAACKPTEKCCAGNCVAPSPLWGCSATTCDPCTVLPDHATGRCNGEQCSFSCIANYTDVGGECVASADSGIGGTSGVPACDPKKCPVCVGGPIYSACCQHDGKCGCAFPAAPCFPNQP